MSQPSHLFSPLTLRSVTLKNRVVIAPLCMYSSVGGFASDWHLSHLGGFARGGAALVFTEATAVEPAGRITHGCCGLWSDAQIEPLKGITRHIERLGAVPGIQLAHAGRKASVSRPWEGSAPLTAAHAAAGEPPWPVVGPCAEAVGPGWPTPDALDEAGIARIVAAFAASARRALAAGFRVLEVHGAHGYLVHSFLSPLANHRNDGYGGDRAGRMRFALEVARAVREVWPSHLPLFFRISSVDGPAGGWSLDDSVALASELAVCGVDVVDCSAGGISGPPHFRADDGGKPLPKGGERLPGFQVPYAERLRRDGGVKTMAVGVIIDPHQAEAIVRDGRADLTAIGREAIYNPYWALHASQALGVDPEHKLWPDPYGWAVRRRAEIREGLKKIGYA